MACCPASQFVHFHSLQSAQPHCPGHHDNHHDEHHGHDHHDEHHGHDHHDDHHHFVVMIIVDNDDDKK